MKTTTALTTLALLTATPLTTQAAIFITGDVTNTTFTLNITTPLTYQITAPNSQVLVFDDWLPTSDGRFDSATPTPPDQTIDTTNTPQANPASPTTQQMGLNFIADNLNTSAGDIGPNDTYIAFSSPIAGTAAGDTLTISPATITFNGNANFNPALSNSTFTGDSFLTDPQGNRTSTNATTIPEPTTPLLASLALIPLLTRRKRQ